MGSFPLSFSRDPKLQSYFSVETAHHVPATCLDGSDHANKR